MLSSKMATLSVQVAIQHHILKANPPLGYGHEDCSNVVQSTNRDMEDAKRRVAHFTFLPGGTRFWLVFRM